MLSTTVGTRPEAFGPVEWSLLAVTALVWGSSFLLIAVALDAFPPALIATLRIAGGALALGTFPAARRPVERADRARLWFLGAFWMGLPFVLFPVAEQWIDSSLAGMLNASTTLFTALLAAVLLRRLPGRRQGAGILVGFVGVVALLAPALEGDASLTGALLVLAASASYAAALTVGVPLQQRYGALPVFLRVQLRALVLVAPFGLLSLPSASFAWRPLAAVATLGVLGTGVAFVAMGTLAGRAGATRASVAIYFVPVVALVLGVAVRDDAVAAVSGVGLALVLLGAALASRREAPVARAADVGAATAPSHGA